MAQCVWVGFEGNKEGVMRMYLKLLKDILEYERRMLDAEILDRVKDGVRFLENGEYVVQAPSIQTSVKPVLEKGKK